ncbi:hypothetical protein CRUP_015375, partial [Coryphaenoides rupestris]
GPAHRLEIAPLPEPEPSQSHSTMLRLADLSSEEEEEIHGRICQYEQKIDSLMMEVSSLKSEVALRKKEQELSVSQRVIAEREEELAEVAKELEVTECENSRLRRSMEKMLGEGTDRRRGRGLSGAESAMLAHQKDLLLQKLETFEATNHTLRQLLRDQHGCQLESMQLAEQKDSLLKRLTAAEAENARLVIKLQDKEKELDQLSLLLDTEKGNAKTSGELTRALESTRAHLQGQLRSKEAENNRLTVQIKERQVADALSTAENWRSRHGQEVKEKTEMQIELSVLNSRVKELGEQLQAAEDKGRVEREALLGHLHGLTADGTAAKLDNHSLKAMLSAAEEKLSVAQTEVQQVKSTVKQYESLLDGYKTQAERVALATRQELETELDQVRRELLSRLTELEPLPDALRRSELRLQETHDREHAQERQSLELSASLADLRRKVETQGSQVEILRQRNTLLLEENKQLQHRVEHTERTLEETSGQNAELLAVIAKREETIQSNQSRLEDKSRECILLNRRLEEALDDARQQVERRYQSRLQDVKDRLEQSDSTNRSLQSYVQFLKASYANVFGESALTSTLRSPSPF